jgi:hypothetical protein
MAKIIQFPSKDQALAKDRVAAVELEFPDRLKRIQLSLMKINQLMAELKQMSKEGTNNVESIKR